MVRGAHAARTSEPANQSFFRSLNHRSPKASHARGARAFVRPSQKYGFVLQTIAFPLITRSIIT